MGISPGGARESSPWREPMETTFCWYLPGVAARGGREKVAQGASHGNKRVRQGAPEGRKNPFTGIHPSLGTKGLLTPLRGWRVSGPVPQGLRPGLFSSAPNGASNRARTRLARREELGIKAQTRVENVETPEPADPEGTPPAMPAF